MEDKDIRLISGGDLRACWPRECKDAERVWAYMPSKIVLEGNDVIHDCFYAVYQKQANLFFAAYRLCELNLGNEARLLERALFELWLIIDQLAEGKEPEKFAADLIAWGHANEHDRLQKLLKRHPEASKDAIAGRFLEILEGKLADVKASWGDNWKDFVKHGPISAGPGSLAWRKGSPLGEYYSMISSVAHSYDLHAYYPYANRNEIEHLLDVRGEVLDNCIVWFANTLELGAKYFPLLNSSDHNSILEIRNRILSQQDV